MENLNKEVEISAKNVMKTTKTKAEDIKNKQILELKNTTPEIKTSMDMFNRMEETEERLMNLNTEQQKLPRMHNRQKTDQKN